MFIISDNIPAVYDLWLLGDTFLKDIIGSFEAIRYQAQRDKEEVPLYIQDTFNVYPYYGSASSGVKHSITRIVNSLIEAIKEHRRLPKYLVVIIDLDMLRDVNVFDQSAAQIINELVRWLVRQVDMILRRKKMDFFGKKAWSKSGFTPMTIYIRMLRRIRSFNDHSRMAGICHLRAKFNDTLNDAIAKVDQYIMTINSCNTDL